MELTNEQRKYWGLELIDPAWERMKILNSIKPEFATGKIILYFDGDILRKTITIRNSGAYLEESCHIKTEENPAVDIETLQALKSCPSQFIMDNRLEKMERIKKSAWILM